MSKCIFLCLCIFTFSISKAADIHRIIESIPLRDRESIEHLFTFLMERDALGYVLFGEIKSTTFISIPITHKEYVLPYKIDNSLYFQKELKKAWHTWKQYEPRFRHPNIIVCEEYQWIENDIYLQLFIIDKKKLDIVLDKYHNDFQEVLGHTFDSHEFIIKLEKSKKLRPLIKRDEKLLGILLGFGREASTDFRDLKNGKEFETPLGRIGKRPSGCPIIPVCFRGDPSSQEVKELVKAYDREILEIEKIFKSSSFLERTLEKFCAP